MAYVSSYLVPSYHMEEVKSYRFSLELTEEVKLVHILGYFDFFR